MDRGWSAWGVQRTFAPLLFAVVSASAAGCSAPQSATEASVTVQGAVSAKANLSPMSAPSTASTADALMLWNRTLAAGRTEPARADVVETRFYPTGSVRSRVGFEAVESPRGHSRAAGCYRLTYASPGAMHGVILQNDGSSVWRSDALHKWVARQSAAAAPLPPELEEGVAALAVPAAGARPEVEPGAETVAGHPAEVLALRTPGSGRIVERRWVDKNSGRTLRLEQYAGSDAHIVRRVEITQLTLLTTRTQRAWADAQLAAPLPPNARVVDVRSSHVRHLAEAEATASGVHLPLHVRGFALRSAARAAPHPRPGLTHLLYSNGDRAISVFVSTDAVKGSAAGAKPAPVLQPGADWRATALPNSRSGFTQESVHGAAVAWTESNGGCYIAVAHMPLADLLPVAQAFAADRDDAPVSDPARR